MKINSTNHRKQGAIRALKHLRDELNDLGEGQDANLIRITTLNKIINKHIDSIERIRE